MKYSAAYLLTLVLGAQGMCDAPGPQRIGDGWFVECTKDLYRQSQNTKEYKVDNISARQCAEKCMEKKYPVCNYHAAKKRCVYGREVGLDLNSPGFFQIKRVEPFGNSGDCEKEKAACLERQRTCEAELAQIKSAVEEYERSLWDL
ncbi:hypothetical protein CEP53_002339 [Fusarium sp. AF-6]|nr:hypothetical protein CEP53_002339 [Fusarium sp. AF-6]